MSTRHNQADFTIPICYMPPLLPDELLFSWLGRIAVLNTIQSHRRYLELLFGTQMIFPVIDLPSKLADLNERLANYSPFANTEEIIDLTTLYPYHRPFLTPCRDAKAKQLIMHGGAKGLKIMIGRVANRFGANPPLRYCAECLLMDIKQHGTSYWHRSHQLPGVTCCVQHNKMLCTQTSNHLTARHQHFVLPPSPTQLTIPPESVNPLQFQFAILSLDLLLANLPASDPQKRSSTYLAAVEKIGLCNKRGNVDFASLAHEMRNYYCDFDGFIHQERLLESSKQPLCWLQPLLNRPSRSLHPICHLLLIGFLFRSIQKFIEALHPPPQHEEGLSASIAKAKLNSNRINDVRIYNPLLLDKSLSCRTVANMLHVSVTTVVTRRRILGIPISERRKSLNADGIKLILCDLSNGLHPSEIAESHHVSLSTVYRLRSQCIDDIRTAHAETLTQERRSQRQDWLRALASSNGIAAARKNSSANYAWLYRNDRDWLLDINIHNRIYRSRGRRVDWASRDEKLTNQAKYFATVLSRAQPRPRISRTRILAQLGETTVRNALTHLPKLQSQINQLAESAKAHQAYRIIQAIKYLNSHNLPIATWRVMRLSRIRKLHPSLKKWLAKLCNYTTLANH